jgi:hypothetical protein
MTANHEGHVSRGESGDPAHNREAGEHAAHGRMATPMSKPDQPRPQLEKLAFAPVWGRGISLPSARRKGAAHAIAFTGWRCWRPSSCSCLSTSCPGIRFIPRSCVYSSAPSPPSSGGPASHERR